MPTKFKLRFPKSEIDHWAKKYAYKNEDLVYNVLAPNIQKQKYLTKSEFTFLCRWKSQRPTKQYEKNDEAFIIEVTKIALTTPNPRLSIEVLTLLQGVSWPVASVILHFGKDNNNLIMKF